MAVGDSVDLPSPLQGIIQQGMLQKEFHDGLRATLGMAQLAVKQPIECNVGATVTDTRLAELAIDLNPNDPVAINGDIDNGLSDTPVTAEQYTLKMLPYLKTMSLNDLEQEATIADRGLKYGGMLGRAMQRIRNGLARQAFLNAYNGGNTVITAVGSHGANTLSLDDIRGFLNKIKNGEVTPVSGTNIMTAQETAAVGGGQTQPLQITGVQADAVNASAAAAVGGISGWVTINAPANAPVVGDVVVAENAPLVFRPNAKQSTGALTGLDIAGTTMILNVVAYLRNQGIPPAFANGDMACVLDHQAMANLMLDPVFLNAYVAQYGSAELVEGRLFRWMGVTFIPTTEMPTQQVGQVTVRRICIVGGEALLVGDFKGLARWAEKKKKGSKTHWVDFADGVAHMVRSPIDRAGQLVTFTSETVTAYCAPTDLGTTSATIATAGSSMYKRGAVIETAG